MARIPPLFLLVVLLWPLVACGIRPQSRHEPVPVTGVLPTPAQPPAGAGSEELLIYLVSGSRLEPVTRSAPERRPQDAVDLLLAGPTRTEVMTGLRTALSAQDLSVGTGPDSSGMVAVTVTRGFTSIGGGNQLLAVAQVVWTVTQFPRIDRVRFLFDGALVQVPTDEGLTDQPVDRGDYLSIAPRPAPTGPPPTTPPPTRSPSPTEPPGGAGSGPPTVPTAPTQASPATPGDGSPRALR